MVKDQYEEINTLRKRIIALYEQTSSWDDAYSNFLENNSVYFAIMMSTIYQNSEFMINKENNIAISIENTLYDIRGKIDKEGYCKLSESSTSISDLLPKDYQDRENKNKEYAMLINSVIDLYYNNLSDRKILPEDIEKKYCKTTSSSKLHV